MVNTIIGIAIVIQFTNVTDTPRAVIDAAQREVTQIFSEIGISVAFRDTTGYESGGVGSLQVTLVPLPYGHLRHTRRPILGSATQTISGTGVAWIYVMRVREEAERHDIGVARVLAGVLAHEIAHLLQPGRGHAESGLMRAAWNFEDYKRLASGALRLSPSDVRKPAALPMR